MNGWTWDTPYEEEVSIQGSGHAEPLPEEQKDHPEFIRDEKTGLFLPAGARKKKQQAGFGADWE